MLLKISLSSMRKMMKDYIVLLVGLVISISIFYMFQTLAMNEEFVKANSMIKSIMLVFNVGAVLLAIITFFYIFYANSFLLSLRRKEYGMYMMLGAKKSKITKLMFIETIVIGLLALAIGIIVGVGISSIVGTSLMAQIDFPSDGYKIFYIPAVLVTLGFFIVLFVLTGIMNAVKLSRTTILDLLRAEQNKEKIRKSGFVTFVLAFFSIVLLAVGYYCMYYMETLREVGLIGGAITTTIGTYLFFMTFMPAWVNSLKRNEKLNSKGINAFTFAQLQFRANSLSKLLGTIAMLIALGVGAIAGGLAFQNNAALIANSMVIADMAIHDATAQDKALIGNMNVKEQHEYRYKLTDKGVYLLKEDLLNEPPLYRKIDRDNNGLMKKDVEPERLVVDLPAPLYINYIPREDAASNKEKLEELPKSWDNVISNELNIGYSVFGKRSIYVADHKHYAQVKGEDHKVFIAYVDDFVKYKDELKQIEERQKEVTKNFGNQPDEEEMSMNSKYGIYTGFYSLASGTMFMGFFLGIAFLAMMASCLMFKILSGANSDIQRYQMLRKIGVRKQLLTKSIYKELLAIFALPGLIGIAHVLIGMNIFSFILANPYYKIWIPVVIFILIYSVYYLITVQLYKGIVLPKERR
ncbi:FtsX-like permease family protein [Paenibacillus sp. N1-5-1-14]|uniref:ABC transporter permease n=1 Tax=Paenibacillus radicibacter TaxID=2972488 RepID=UPI002159A7CD|nr:FtsX-like permease family protein [Paenibacillus radicibacter]MCR8645978.1 FtsX-like permease family protein [Paenibacillus radicibacter]